MTSKELVNKMYETLHNTIAPSSPDDTGLQHIFTMMPQGLAINPDDFDPEKSTGRANRNRLLNAIPLINKEYTPSTSRVTDAYQIVLTSVIPPDKPLTEAEKQTLKDAYEFVSDSTNQTAYLNAMELYQEKRLEYWTARNNNEMEDRKSVV